MAALRRYRTLDRCITRGTSNASPAAPAAAPLQRWPRAWTAVIWHRDRLIGAAAGIVLRHQSALSHIRHHRRHGSFRGAWSQDHVGLFCRTVKDIALALDPVAGFDARDPASVRQDAPAYAERLNENVKRLRVGVLGNSLTVSTSRYARHFSPRLKFFPMPAVKSSTWTFPDSATPAMTSMLTSSAESAGSIAVGFVSGLRTTCRMSPAASPSAWRSPHRNI